MATCSQCGKRSEEIAGVLSLCADCIRQADKALPDQLRQIHARGREAFGLPGRPPEYGCGIRCSLCQNGCRIPDGEYGYCGVRRHAGGKLAGGTPEGAVVSWYDDPLPTNCVADWVCGEGTGGASRTRGGQHRYNLAVFYEACTFDCLFCQNWHYRERSAGQGTRTAQDLADAVTPDTACICYFGGDPTCQLPHALAASELALKRKRRGPLRICWETNGSMSPTLLGEIVSLSLETGGCVKFDLKAWDKSIHHALCGVDNARTFKNFARAAKRLCERPDPPPLVASTLLVPGYVDHREVGAIASFVADLDPGIPYALLGFHGDFLMSEMPTTSREQAERCLAAAKAAGLTRVRLGNVHLFR